MYNSYNFVVGSGVELPVLQGSNGVALVAQAAPAGWEPDGLHFVVLGCSLGGSIRKLLLMRNPGHHWGQLVHLVVLPYWGMSVLCVVVPLLRFADGGNP